MEPLAAISYKKCSIHNWNLCFIATEYTASGGLLVSFSSRNHACLFSTILNFILEEQSSYTRGKRKLSALIPHPESTHAASPLGCIQYTDGAMTNSVVVLSRHENGALQIRIEVLRSSKRR